MVPRSDGIWNKVILLMAGVDENECMKRKESIIRKQGTDCAIRRGS